MKKVREFCCLYDTFSFKSTLDKVWIHRKLL